MWISTAANRRKKVIPYHLSMMQQIFRQLNFVRNTILMVKARKISGEEDISIEDAKDRIKVAQRLSGSAWP